MTIAPFLSIQHLPGRRRQSEPFDLLRASELTGTQRRLLLCFFAGSSQGIPDAPAVFQSKAKRGGKQAIEPSGILRQTGLICYIVLYGKAYSQQPNNMSRVRCYCPIVFERTG
jgi:hypothetical protein